MGRKYKQRLIPEQDSRICGSICLCQLTIVLSCVSIVYLSVAVYLPSYKAFQSGYEPDPVMCQTVNTTIANNCQWVSCGEWCLTKTGGLCTQIHATVRRNGTDVIFENCTRSSLTNCPQVDPQDLTKYNCNNGSACANLLGVFNCSLGHCTNMSELYDCHYKTESYTIDAEKDNMKLNGFFYCKGTNCTRIKKDIVFDRYCPKVTTSSINVFIMHNDSLTTAQCKTALATNEARGSNPGIQIEPTVFWEANENDTVITNCMDAVRIGNKIRATDCLNGTVLHEDTFPIPFMNFTQFRKIYEESDILLDPQQRFLPKQSVLTIYNSSKLHINTEGCVNTLRSECKEFHQTHGNDGDNNTAQSRFLCYYNKNNSEFVLTRFDLERTWRELLVAIIIPSTLFVISFITLCIITQSVKVGDDAKMRCTYCTGSDSELDQLAGGGGNNHKRRCKEAEKEPILKPSTSQSPGDLNEISPDLGDSSTKSLIPLSPCTEMTEKTFMETLKESSLSEMEPTTSNVTVKFSTKTTVVEEKPLMVL